MLRGYDESVTRGTQDGRGQHYVCVMCWWEQGESEDWGLTETQDLSFTNLYNELNLDRNGSLYMVVQKSHLQKHTKYKCYLFVFFCIFY